MIRVLVALFVIASSAIATEPCEANEELDAAYAEVVEDVVDKLHRLASWCSSSKLYLERDKAFESVLYFDPGDFKAHKGLKHKLERDGTWTVPEDREPSKNYKLSKLGKCEERRAKLLAAFREDVASLFSKFEKDVTRQHHERVNEAVLRIDPDHAEVRALRGEVRLKDSWVLAETDATIADVAARCGFYDQPDFTRRFARLTNATPAQFRATAKAAGESPGGARS